jgi:hypothetical protein
MVHVARIFTLQADPLSVLGGGAAGILLLHLGVHLRVHRIACMRASGSSLGDRRLAVGRHRFAEASVPPGFHSNDLVLRPRVHRH